MANSEIIFNNGTNPTAPEFGKAWKAENNGGCCPCPTSGVPTVCTTVVQKFTRYSQSIDLTTEKDCGCTAPIVAQDNCPSSQQDIDCV